MSLRTSSVCAALLAATGLRCAEPEPHPPPGPPTAPPPEFLIAGCEDLAPGPVCRLQPDATLSLWIGVHRDTRLALELSGQPLDVTWTAAEDGLRTALTPAERVGPLVLRDLDADWRLSVDLRVAAGLPPALQDIERLSLAGKYDQAARLLAASLQHLDGVERAMGLKLVGDNEFLRGDLAAMQRAYDDAFAASVSAGMLRSASTMALTVVFLCSERLDDTTCARRWLARHGELQASLPEARVRQAYYAGLIADREGDTRAAIRSFEQSVRDARALGLDTDLCAALLKLGAVLSRLGDGPAPAAAYVELLSLGDRLSLEDRARVLNSAAWIALEARARGERLADPTPRLVEALAIVSPAGPRPDAHVAAEVQLNLAHAALLAGDPGAAATTLGQCDPPNRRLERLHMWLSARVDLAESRFAPALRRFEQLAAQADAADDRWLAWSAAVGAGEALEGLGRPAPALEQYRHAAQLHSVRLAALAVDASRERFAAEGDRGARRLVDLLLRLGRVDEAACAARLARGQTYAGLTAASRGRAALARYRDARDALDAALERTWERPRRSGEQERTSLRAEARRLDVMLDAALTDEVTAAPRCDALYAPGSGELILLYYPLERGVAGFARDEHGVRGALLTDDAADDDAQARRMLDPFAPEIARTRRIRVIASGSSSAVAIHALPWSGRPLIDHASVSYALDLPRAAAVAAPLRRAVQLAPPSNLAAAPAELAAAAAALQARGVALERLDGDEPDLRSRLGTDLLHYVGHAHADSWASALHLGGERRLAAGDLISAAAPTTAVLSGCETGLADPGSHAGGMSLAHALLVAGASAVIATDAKVDDVFASTLIPAVIGALADGVAPEEALRRAQRERTGHAEWSRFRVFVP